MGTCCSSCAKASSAVSPAPRSSDSDSGAPSDLIIVGGGPPPGDIVVGSTSNPRPQRVSPAPPALDGAGDGSRLVFFERASAEVTASSLVSMSKQGKLCLVMDMLQRGADVNVRGMFGNTPLICACQYNHESIALALLEVDGIDIHHTNMKGGSALTYACLEGMQHGVEMLLRKGAHPIAPEAILYNSKTDKNDYLSPLSAAVINGHSSIVSHLLSAAGAEHVNTSHRQFSMLPATSGSSADKATISGVTSLMLACKHNHTDVVEMLLTRNADCHLADSAEENMLHYVCRSKGAEDTLRLLRQLDRLSPTLITAKNCRGDTPLHLCCDGKNVAAASILLTYLHSDGGRQAVRQERKGDQAAHTDAVSAVVQVIISQAISCALADKVRPEAYEMNFVPSYRNISGKTPLHLAVKRRSAGLVALLLEYDFDPMIADNDGVSARDMAMQLPASSPILSKIDDHLAEKKQKRVAAALLRRRQRVEQAAQEARTEDVTCTPLSSRPVTPVFSSSDAAATKLGALLKPPPSRQELLSAKRQMNQRAMTESPLLLPPVSTTDKQPETEQELDDKKDSDTREAAMLEPVLQEFTTPMKSSGAVLSPVYTSGAELNMVPVYSGSNYKEVTSAPRKQRSVGDSGFSKKAVKKCPVLQPPPPLSPQLLVNRLVEGAAATSC